MLMIRVALAMVYVTEAIIIQRLVVLMVEIATTAQWLNLLEMVHVIVSL